MNQASKTSRVSFEFRFLNNTHTRRMSLPNDDDQDGRQPWRDPFGHRDEAAINPIKKVTAASNDIDDRTTDETSVGSMSFSSDMTSVVAPGGTTIPATPIRQAPARDTNIDTPISMLTTTTPVVSDSASVHSGMSCNSTEDEASIQLRRQRNRIQLQVLGASTGATFALFIYILIPTAVILSMILFGGVSSAFLYQLANTMQWEFHRSILEGRGIGDYLPENIYQLLTSSSIHELLSDPNGILAPSEHLPYLLLYLIPGLTPEQINQYVNRLDPSHQRLLRSEQGLLGYLLNPSENSNQNSILMRFIMGDQRLREWREHQYTSQHPSNMTPRQLDLPPTIPEEEAPTRTEEENAGDSSEPMGIPETVAAVVDAEAVSNPPPEVTPAIDNSMPNQRPSAISETVLFDAVGDAVANFVSDTTNSVRERVHETFEDNLAGPIYRASLGMALLGLGVGTLGLANGTYDLQSLVRPIGQFVTSLFGGGGNSGGGPSQSSGPWVRLSLTMPSGSVLVGSTIASGTTAVVLGLFGTTRSRSMGDDGETPPPQTPTTTATSTNGSEPPKC